MKLNLALWFLGLTTTVTAQEYQAEYRVTFVGEWSPNSHPTSYPNNAHFSALVGSTHNQHGGLWKPGGLASVGIESMAESGGTILLRGEIEDLITAGVAESQLLGSSAGALSTIDFEFIVTESHPKITLTTMIAPSPDWFIGVHDLSLISGGQWSEEVVVDLLPFDAGTDSGTSFTSPDNDTNPAVPISRITHTPLANEVPLGRFIFTRLSTSGELANLIFGSGFE